MLLGAVSVLKGVSGDDERLRGVAEHLDRPTGHVHDGGPAAELVPQRPRIAVAPRVRLEPVAPADRPQELLAQRMYADRVVQDPAAILQLAALPMVTLTRPPGRAGLHAGASALIDRFG